MLFDDLQMSKEWIPKSRDSNWKSTSPSVSFNCGKNDWKSDERRSLVLDAKESMEIDMKVLQNKEFDRQQCRVWKCEASEEILEVGQDWKTEETVWQP